MARRSRSTGVGRGNAAGSARTQFKDGMPSGNPNGRPKKEKPPPPRDVGELLTRKLAAPVEGQIDGRDVKMPYIDAILNCVLNDATSKRTSPSARIRLLKELMALTPDVVSAASHRPSEGTIEAFLHRLSARTTGDDVAPPGAKRLSDER